MSKPSSEPPPTHMLGDKVAAVTSALGFKPCARCKRRQEVMNKIRTEQGLLSILKNVVEAVVNTHKPYLCESCSAPAQHVESWNNTLGFRAWCEAHTPWSGHYEWCPKPCKANIERGMVPR